MFVRFITVARLNNASLFCHLLCLYVSPLPHPLPPMLLLPSSLSLLSPILPLPPAPPLSPCPSPSHPPPNTEGLCSVLALYSYTADNADELTFHKGSVITVLSKDADTGWWHGELDNKKGLFPSNYVQTLDDQLPLPSSRCECVFTCLLAPVSYSSVSLSACPHSLSDWGVTVHTI